MERAGHTRDSDGSSSPADAKRRRVDLHTLDAMTTQTAEAASAAAVTATTAAAEAAAAGSVSATFSAAYFASLPVRSGIQAATSHVHRAAAVRVGRAANQLLRRTLHRCAQHLDRLLPQEPSPSFERVQAAVVALARGGLADMLVERMRLVEGRAEARLDLPIPEAGAGAGAGAGAILSPAARTQLTTAFTCLVQDMLRAAGEVALAMLHVKDLSAPRCSRVPLEGEGAAFAPPPMPDVEALQVATAETPVSPSMGFALIRVLHLQQAVWDDGDLADLLARLGLAEEYGLTPFVDAHQRQQLEARVGPTVRIATGGGEEADSEPERIWCVPCTAAQCVRLDRRLLLEEYPATQACVRQLCERYAWFHQEERVAEVLQAYLAIIAAGSWEAAQPTHLGRNRWFLRPWAYYGRTMQPRWCTERSEQMRLLGDSGAEDSEELGSDENGADQWSHRSWLAYAAHAFDLIDADGREFPLLVEFAPDCHPDSEAYCAHGGLFDRFTGRMLAELDSRGEGACAHLLVRDGEFARFFRAYRPHDDLAVYADVIGEDADVEERCRVFDNRIKLERVTAATAPVCFAQWAAPGRAPGILQHLLRLCVAGMALVDDGGPDWLQGLDRFQSTHPPKLVRRFGVEGLRTAFAAAAGHADQGADSTDPEQPSSSSSSAAAGAASSSPSPPQTLPDVLLGLIAEYAPAELPWTLLEPKCAVPPPPTAVAAPPAAAAADAGADAYGEEDEAIFVFDSGLRADLRLVVDDNDAHSRLLPLPRAKEPRPPVHVCSIARVEGLFVG